MKLLADILVAAIALLHVYILWLEMFAWTTRGKKVFRSIPADLFEKTKTLAANQGLYNGFLAAGLVWSLCIIDPTWSANVSYFFLSCIAIAGVYGAITAQRSILFVQTIPATAAMFVLWLSGN
jgi:putative membrane protein